MDLENQLKNKVAYRTGYQTGILQNPANPLDSLNNEENRAYFYGWNDGYDEAKRIEEAYEDLQMRRKQYLKELR